MRSGVLGVTGSSGTMPPLKSTHDSQSWPLAVRPVSAPPETVSVPALPPDKSGESASVPVKTPLPPGVSVTVSGPLSVLEVTFTPTDGPALLSITWISTVLLEP